MMKQSKYIWKIWFIRATDKIGASVNPNDMARNSYNLYRVVNGIFGT